MDLQPGKVSVNELKSLALSVSNMLRVRGGAARREVARPTGNLGASGEPSRGQRSGGEGNWAGEGRGKEGAGGLSGAQNWRVKGRLAWILQGKSMSAPGPGGRSRQLLVNYSEAKSLQRLHRILPLFRFARSSSTGGGAPSNRYA